MNSLANLDAGQLGVISVVDSRTADSSQNKPRNDDSHRLIH